MYGKKEHCQLKREREFNYTTITQINQRGVSKRCIHYADNMVMKLLDHCSSIWICWTINLDLCLSNLFKLTYNIKKEWSQCHRKGQGQQIRIWLISSYLYGSLKLYGKTCVWENSRWSERLASVEGQILKPWGRNNPKKYDLDFMCCHLVCAANYCV